MYRGRGTGEAGEAAASPEIQRLTKVNTKFSLPEKKSYTDFFAASPENIPFRGPCELGF